MYYSGDDYDESDSSGAETPVTCSDVVRFPIYMALGVLLLFLLPVLPLLLLIAYCLVALWSSIREKTSAKRSHLVLVLVGIMVVEALVCVFLHRQICSLPPSRRSRVASIMTSACAPAQPDTAAPSRPPASTPRPAPVYTPAALPQAPLAPFAVYSLSVPETPIAVKPDTRLAACEGKPLYHWR